MTKFRLRPSTAFVPVAEDTFDFFQSNTRRSRRYNISGEFADVVSSLNGSNSIDEKDQKIMRLMDIIHDKCLIEIVEFSDIYNASPWRRIINFIGDFVPSDKVIEHFSRIQNTSIIIFGLGAVGSWVAWQLAKSGFVKFIIIDNDHVELSNLSRSLYVDTDVGSLKVNAMEHHIKMMVPDALIDKKVQRVESQDDVFEVICHIGWPKIVINCADEPSVDETSDWVDAACQKSLTPYIIAGGYNLHLSLIGMTVIPRESACYRCSRITLDEMQSHELVGLKRLNRPWRNIGNLSPLAAITSSFAACEAIRLALISDKIHPVMLNKRGEFNFLTNTLNFVSLPRRRECHCMIDGI